MKIPDVNVLLAAANADAPAHAPSRRWLENSLAGGAPVGLAWVALLGFVRIATHPRVFATPLTGDQAMGVVEQLLAAPTAHVVHPGSTHATRMRELLRRAGSGGNLTTDAHLAALALEHKGTIVTFDSDFDRFAGVRWERPS
ncbi:TA system VapC family ribonuclease toxin [Nocardioides limicola]|uniref:TA system VapC family ribonuclease toxin n=1 Tax=Nocardioides limicola TaxID=2803368 RepID=UPI00193B0715|nr:TA system VapC family ribonuclease toxin [Nocardioides sp. DJM-14]